MSSTKSATHGHEVTRPNYHTLVGGGVRISGRRQEEARPGIRTSRGGRGVRISGTSGVRISGCGRNRRPGSRKHSAAGTGARHRPVQAAASPR
ncbi:hypothetical protein JOF55_001217 [Haloactinomyces albus]|uniref:Uncharacterized protein n=1 Tax=Haloactinomyces albus TaxID=1352928 RepID=A0AAE3ZC91_9ACTN|nr:hypothetical protein [Haloactinomyces albus]